MGTADNTPNLLPLSQGNLDVMAKTATATAMALSTSYCLERKGLCDVTYENSFLEILKRTDGKSDFVNLNWVKVEQVGKPLGTNFQSCYSALQNILHSCALPRQQLVFLIIGEKGIFNIYIGLHGHSGTIAKNATTIKEIDSFINVCWPGMSTTLVNQYDSTIKEFSKKKFDKAYAFTGIPSLDFEKTSYPSSIEHLIGGSNPSGDIAYLVVAEPVEEKEIDKLIYACDEIRGQAKSFESFSFSESLQEGKSQSFTNTLTDTIGKTETDGTSNKDFSPVIKALKWGLGIAALVFPPAVGLGVGMTAANVLFSSATLSSGGSALIGLGFLSSLLPQKTHSESQNTQHSESNAITNSISENYSKTLGATIVNGHIETISEQLKFQKNRFLAGKAKGMWRTGCYLFTDRYNLSSQLQLKSILSGESSQLEPIRIHDITSLIKNDMNDEDNRVIPFITPPDFRLVTREDKAIFAHPFGQEFSTLTTYLTTEELTSMVNFPLHSVPGVSVVECPPEFPLNIPNKNMDSPISIGNLLYHNKKTDISASFDLNTLTRHSLVCGTNGSGKTNTILGILNEIQRHGRNFMVIEPAKTEYVDWAISFNEKLEEDHKQGKRLKEAPITIYMPGRNHYWHTKNGNNEKYILKDILKINPFEPVTLDEGEPNVQSHLDRIKSIFSLAFPMEDILPTVMETLLTDVYTNGEQWLNRKEGDPIPELFPTLSLLRCRSTNVIKSLGYEQRVTANISAAINLRLTNLLSGWKRDLFNNEVLGGYKYLSKEEIRNGVKRPTWDDLFNSRVVVNLSGIADDNDRVLVMGLLLLYLYEYRVATSQSAGFSFNDETLHHLMVIEEAHRVMTKSADPNSPQYKCGALFSQMLSEIRAYGQGLMVVDQIPNRLIEDATKNTNMKIVHRLIAADDIESVSNSMGVNEDQKRIFPRLSVGQAVIAGLNASKSDSTGGEDVYWVKIKKNK